MKMLYGIAKKNTIISLALIQKENEQNKNN